MTEETKSKIETILISSVNRLYSKEESIGLEYEDFKVLEIIFKIVKDHSDTTSPISIQVPSSTEDIVELLKSVRGFTPRGE